jgi:hypothetical protein
MSHASSAADLSGAVIVQDPIDCYDVQTVTIIQKTPSAVA